MEWYEYFDGTSGKPVVRFNRECMEACSASGPVDNVVPDLVDKADWLVETDELRELLKSEGAWDDLDVATEQVIRERMLWLACCTVNESEDDSYVMDYPMSTMNLLKRKLRESYRDLAYTMSQKEHADEHWSVLMGVLTELEVMGKHLEGMEFEKFKRGTYNPRESLVESQRTG